MNQTCATIEVDGLPFVRGLTEHELRGLRDAVVRGDSWQLERLLAVVDRQLAAEWMLAFVQQMREAAGNALDDLREELTAEPSQEEESTEDSCGMEYAATAKGCEPVQWYSSRDHAARAFFLRNGRKRVCVVQGWHSRNGVSTLAGTWKVKRSEV